MNIRKIIAIIIVVLCMGAFVYRVIKTPGRIKAKENKTEQSSQESAENLNN